MFQKVRDTFFKSFQVFVVEVSFGYAAVVFQSTYGCYDNNCTWMQVCHTAFDIEEFLSTEVCTESCFCDRIISKFHCHLGCCYGVTSMSDVCEWSAVYDCRNVLQCLNEVRFQGVFQEGCHSAFCMEITCCYRFLLGYFTVGISNNNSGKSFFQVFDVTCKTKNCHDLRCNSDVISVFTRHSVCSSAEAVYYVTELTVIHVYASSPCDLSWIDVQSVALENVVVDHCCEQVVCCADRMEVTCEVKVDILHRNYLCIAAACCTALNTEYRSERWLTESYHNALAEPLHTVCKTYCCSCFSFTCRCRVDSSYEDQLAVLFVAFFQEIVINLCFVLTILLQIFVVDACFFCDLGDRLHCALLCNFDVTFESHNFLLSLPITSVVIAPSPGDHGVSF